MIISLPVQLLSKALSTRRKGNAKTDQQNRERVVYCSPLHLIRITDRQEMIIKEEVRAGLESQQPIVALESTVIAHGLPRPQNLDTARRLEQSCARRALCPRPWPSSAGGSASDSTTRNSNDWPEARAS